RIRDLPRFPQRPAQWSRGDAYLRRCNGSSGGLVSISGDRHMRGGVVPPALLFMALSLALTFAPRGAWVPGLLALRAALGAFSSWSVPPVRVEGVFLGCWISVIATALSVHLGRGLTRTAALVLSLNTGVWASAVVSVSGSRFDLLKALPCVLIFLPAS